MVEISGPRLLYIAALAFWAGCAQTRKEVRRLEAEAKQTAITQVYHRATTLPEHPWGQCIYIRRASGQEQRYCGGRGLDAVSDGQYNYVPVRQQ